MYFRVEDDASFSLATASKRRSLRRPIEEIGGYTNSPLNKRQLDVGCHKECRHISIPCYFLTFGGREKLASGLEIILTFYGHLSRGNFHAFR